MRNPGQLFQRMMRKAQRDTHLPIVAVAIMPAPSGAAHAVAYAIEGANMDQLERATITLLELVKRYAAEGDASCPCCADRLERATAAITAFGAKPDEPIQRTH